MKYRAFHLWLRRVTIALCAYAFTMIIVMHFVGYKPILPNHPNKDYPILGGVPPVSQASIIKAVNNFEIQIPMFSRYPSLDMDMDKSALGEARFSVLLNMCAPTIGPGAFTSWNMLGAILAHEVEVHCNQNWWKSYTDRIFGDDPTPMLEREAYIYTVLDRKRFHLTLEEQLDILAVMLYLYPVGDKNEQRQGTQETKERTHGPAEGP